MNKKTTYIALLLISTVLVMLSACSSDPMATATPALSEEERIEQAIADLHKIEVESAGTYYKTLAFLDRQSEPLDDTQIIECVPSINVRTTDENGRISYENSLQSFVYGAYIFAPKIVLPDLTPRPPPAKPPFLTDAEYEKFVENYKNNLPDPSKNEIRIWIGWERHLINPKNEDEPSSLISDFVEKVDIENEIIREKLDELGIIVLKRNMIEQKRARPDCLHPNIGSSLALEGADVLVFSEYVEGQSAIIKGSYMSPSREKHGFYFQGSIVRRMLGSPIFAFRKTTQEPELVGIVTLTGDPLETRGFAVSIDYILELMDLAGIDVTEIPDEPEE